MTEANAKPKSHLLVAVGRPYDAEAIIRFGPPKYLTGLNVCFPRGPGAGRSYQVADYKPFA